MDIIKTTKKMPAERRFTLQSAVAIIVFLVGVIAFLFKDSNKVKREQYESVLIENKSLKQENNSLKEQGFYKDRKYDSLQLYDKIEYMQLQDSMKYQWRELSKTLTSK